MTEAAPPLRVLIVGLVALLAVIAAFVTLAVTNHDTTTFVSFVGTLAAVAGLGVHSEIRTRQQNVRIRKIDEQTNGVLTKRIEVASANAVRKVLREVGMTFPED